jgi:predicted lysophospholipase L1 biosynthesis ABC-type transport system permease subunit
VLFAFLLAVPFAQGWDKATPFQKDVFFIAFIAAAVSSVLFIAPSSIHRIGWREADKGAIVRVSNWLAIGGLATLAVAMTAAALLVTDYIFPRGTAIATAACVGALFVVVWFVLAVYLRSR